MFISDGTSLGTPNNLRFQCRQNSWRPARGRWIAGLFLNSGFFMTVSLSTPELTGQGTELRRPARILIIEDEKDAVELLQFSLGASGYRTLAAGDGWTGVQTAERERPDLILLDLMLPELDGIAVCELLRRKESTAHIPIIMLTACATEDARVIGLEAGADDYVTKPFSQRELMVRIRRLLPPWAA